jgi:hypothetical protein
LPDPDPTPPGPCALLRADTSQPELGGEATADWDLLVGELVQRLSGRTSGEFSAAKIAAPSRSILASALSAEDMSR